MACYHLKSCNGRFIATAETCSDVHSTPLVAKVVDATAIDTCFVLVPQPDMTYYIKVWSREQNTAGGMMRLRFEEGSVEATPEMAFATPVSLNFDERGRVSVYGGYHDTYMSVDDHGKVHCQSKERGRWERFELLPCTQHVKERRVASCVAPVRVNLKTCRNRYLCTAASVLSGTAEAPCCCEEVLLDMPLADSGVGYPTTLQHGGLLQEQARDAGALESSGSEDAPLTDEACRLRTADGASMVSVELDSHLSLVPVTQARGRESFSVELAREGPCSSVQLRWQQGGSGEGAEVDSEGPMGLYLAAEPSGSITCTRPRPRRWECFNLELASGSRVLIRSAHGGFLGKHPRPWAVWAHGSGGAQTPQSATEQPGGEEDTTQRHRVSCVLRTREAVEAVGAWQLRSHGDALYTIVATPSTPGRGDVYLFVDQHGLVMQSNEPDLHFPATASMFRIEAVPFSREVGITSGRRGGAAQQRPPAPAAVAGFALRSMRPVRGKQRFLSVDPNGRVTASRLRPRLWETFGIIDVDAVAASASPNAFACMPAATTSRHNLPPTVPEEAAALPGRGGGFPGAGGVSRAALAGFLPARPLNMLGRGAVAAEGQLQRRPRRGGIHVARGGPAVDAAAAVAAEVLAEEGRKRTAAAAVRKAAGVAVDAVNRGQAVPCASLATLQELCVACLCTAAMSDTQKANAAKKTKSPSKKTPGGAPCGGLFHPRPLQERRLSLNTGHLRVSTSPLLPLGPPGTHLPLSLPRQLHILPDDLLDRVLHRHMVQQRGRHKACKHLPGANAVNGAGGLASVFFPFLVGAGGHDRLSGAALGNGPLGPALAPIPRLPNVWAMGAAAAAAAAQGPGQPHRHGNNLHQNNNNNNNNNNNIAVLNDHHHHHHHHHRHHNRSAAESGWECASCLAQGILPMDPSVNPAHHRYLELLLQAQSAVFQPTGILWHAISITGISIMAGALFFHAMDLSAGPG